MIWAVPGRITTRKKSVLPRANDRWITGGLANGVLNGAGSALCEILEDSSDRPLTERSIGRATAAPASTDIFTTSRRVSSMGIPLPFGSENARNGILDEPCRSLYGKRCEQAFDGRLRKKAGRLLDPGFAPGRATMLPPGQPGAWRRLHGAISGAGMEHADGVVEVRTNGGL